MIGFFDSGFGGLQSMKCFRELYPDYDYIFLADSKNCPYGNKSPEEIKKLTFSGLDRLFDHGAKIVILACNTASAYAIRPWQQQYPEKKVLSITIPGIETLIEKYNHGHIGILATQATINSGIYPNLISKYKEHKDMTLEYVPAPKLVEIVEKGFDDTKEIEDTIEEYMHHFSQPLDCLVLGCTHFPVLMEHFQKLYKGEIIHPSYESALRLGDYLSRHPEINNELTQNGTAIYYTSGSSDEFDRIGSKIMEYAIQAIHTEIKK